MLRAIAPDLKIVKGRMDVEATSLPLSQVVTHGSLRVGFVEGFTLVSSAGALCRRLSAERLRRSQRLRSNDCARSHRPRTARHSAGTCRASPALANA